MSSAIIVLHPIDTPMCDGIVRHYRDGEGPHKCGFVAKYQIEEKNFCDKHAGYVALQLLLRQSQDVVQAAMKREAE